MAATPNDGQEKFSAEDRSEAQEAGDYGREKTGRASLKEAITGAGRVQSKETQGTTGIDVPGSLTGEAADRLEEALGMARKVVTDTSISGHGAGAALPK